MQASRDVACPAGSGRVLRAPLPRPWRTRYSRDRLPPAGLVSALLHMAAVLLLLLALPAAPPAEQQAAPSFAVEFNDAGVTAPTPSTQAPQPEVNLGGPETEAIPPPIDQPALPLPKPRPARRYGSNARPRTNANPFAHITPFDLSPQSRSFASASNGRSLDLSAGPVVRDGRLQDSVVHVMSGHGTSDWGERLREFVEEHKYYPQAAADNGEQGSAVLRLTVNRDGTVKTLSLVSSSGSHLLDAAWMAVFRDNRLPAFNDDMAQNETTLDVELDYHLIYPH